MNVLPVVLLPPVSKSISSYLLKPYLLVLHFAKAQRVFKDRVNPMSRRPSVKKRTIFREREMSQILVTHEGRLSVQRVKVCRCKHPLFLRILTQNYRCDMLPAFVYNLFK